MRRELFLFATCIAPVIASDELNTWEIALLTTSILVWTLTCACALHYSRMHYIRRRLTHVQEDAASQVAGKVPDSRTVVDVRSAKNVIKNVIAGDIGAASDAVHAIKLVVHDKIDEHVISEVTAATHSAGSANVAAREAAQVAKEAAKKETVATSTPSSKPSSKETLANAPSVVTAAITASAAATAAKHSASAAHNALKSAIAGDPEAALAHVSIAKEAARVATAHASSISTTKSPPSKFVPRHRLQRNVHSNPRLYPPVSDAVDHTLRPQVARVQKSTSKTPPQLRARAPNRMDRVQSLPTRYARSSNESHARSSQLYREQVRMTAHGRQFGGVGARR